MSALHMEVVGKGPDLVLLHGWSLNLRVWDGLTQELFDRFRIISVDLPGHGRSPWDAAHTTPAEHAWLVHQSLASVSNRYSLLGWSLGGQIALDLAAAMPAQVERLILVATSAKFAAGSDFPHGMPRLLIDMMAERLRSDYRRSVSDFLDLQVRGSAGSGSILKQLQHALLVHGEAQPAALAAGLNTLLKSDLRASLGHIQAPTLAIAGQHDRITRPAATRALAQALPHARFVEMPHAAHAPFLSHRKEFATLVANFLTAQPRRPKRRNKKIRSRRLARQRAGKTAR
jgi:pimeloyl-[acyl-carrier protein] methyl ester esterase